MCREIMCVMDEEATSIPYSITRAILSTFAQIVQGVVRFQKQS